jgi:hypothetical protein
MRKVCPNCGSKIGIWEIIFGIPVEPDDDSKFVLGGCCISSLDPTSTCIECGLEGDYENLAHIFGS